MEDHGDLAYGGTLRIVDLFHMGSESILTEEKYRKLKQEVEDAKTEAERAKGALGQLLNRIKEEFDCNNLEEAQKKLKSLLRQQEEAQAAFETALKAYEKKWKRPTP